VFRIKSVGAGFIEADRPLIHTIKPAWSAMLTEHAPGIQNVGVEDLTVTFKK